MIESERLIIRNWLESDIEAYYNIVSDSNTMKFIGNGKPQNLHTATEYTKECMVNYKLFGWSRLAVIKKNQPFL